MWLMWQRVKESPSNSRRSAPNNVHTAQQLCQVMGRGSGIRDPPTCLQDQPVASTAARSTGSPTRPLSTCTRQKQAALSGGKTGAGLQRAAVGGTPAVAHLTEAKTHAPVGAGSCTTGSYAATAGMGPNAPSIATPPCWPLQPTRPSPTCSRLWQHASTRDTAWGNVFTSATSFDSWPAFDWRGGCVHG